MRKMFFWISSTIWLFSILGLFIYKYSAISYPVLELKRIVDIGLMIGIPVLLLSICCLLGNSKRKSAIKHFGQIVFVLFTFLISLIDFFLLSVLGVYSSTKAVDHYLIPDRDVIIDPVVYSIFPQGLSKAKSYDYLYVRGKSLWFFDGNGWRIALSATYDLEQYESEINRLQEKGVLTSPRKYSESIDDYSVPAQDQDSVRINVLVSEKDYQIIYYAQYLDLARFSKEDVLSDFIIH